MASRKKKTIEAQIESVSLPGPKDAARIDEATATMVVGDVGDGLAGGAVGVVGAVGDLETESLPVETEEDLELKRILDELNKTNVELTVGQRTTEEGLIVTEVLDLDPDAFRVNEFTERLAVRDADAPILTGQPMRKRMFATLLVEKGFDVALAAEAAGYNPTTMGKHAFAVQCKRLINDPMVKARVRQILWEREKASYVTKDRIIVELWRIAKVNMLDVIKWDDLETGDEINVEKDGTLTVPSLKVINRDTGAAIKEITKTKQGWSIKFWDKLNAMKQISLMLGYNITEEGNIFAGLSNNITIQFVKKQENSEEVTAEVKAANEGNRFKVIDTRKVKEGVYEPS